MGACPLSALTLVLVLGAGPDPTIPAAPGRPRPGGELSAEDARYLDWLVDDFLFDPRRATYVRVTAPATRDGRNSRFQSDDEARDGWLVRGTNGDPDRVHFVDGESVVVPADRLTHLDFETLCAARFARWRPTGHRYDHAIEIRRLVREWDRRPETPEESALVVAAWLHRRGYDRLAAVALAYAREREDTHDGLRAGLARRASDAAVRAFVARDDGAAVAHVARLHALYPDLAGEYPQAAAVVADVTRRQRVGIGSREPPNGPPPGFAGWDPARQIAFLIGALDEADGEGGWRLWGSHLVHDWAGDWRTGALRRLGDAAVPALIDALEHDGRLARQNHGERQILICGSRSRPPERAVEVRDVAEDVLRSILRVGDFDPTGPAADDDEDRSPKAQAERLRRYWARYGRRPLADRLMRVLTDPAARPAARREAGECLVFIDDEDRSWVKDGRRRKPGPSPVVDRYTRPTVGEAILAAMDHERATQTEEERQAGRWDRYETDYLRLLTRLGDVRVGPELARRANAAGHPAGRLRLAEAACALGVRGPIVRLAREVAAGAVTFPPPADPDRPAGVQTEAAVRELVDALIDAGMPEVTEALYAVADPGHPYFPMAVRGAMADTDDHRRQRDNRAWQKHPLCLLALRHALTDPRPTGKHSYRRGPEVEDWDGQKSRWHTPPGGADPDRWAEHVEHRVGDEAAARLTELVVGLPEYHPLRRDADRVRAAMRDFVVRYSREFRQATWDEQRRWGLLRYGEAVYVPDLKPLGRPATAADVRAGRAVFDLGGAGRVADGKVPAWVTLKADADNREPAWGRVVQAEAGPDGRVVYGVIFRRTVRAVRADEVGKAENAER